MKNRYLEYLMSVIIAFVSSFSSCTDSNRGYFALESKDTIINNQSYQLQKITRTLKNLNEEYVAYYYKDEPLGLQRFSVGDSVTTDIHYYKWDSYVLDFYNRYHMLKNMSYLPTFDTAKFSHFNAKYQYTNGKIDTSASTFVHFKEYQDSISFFANVPYLCPEDFWVHLYILFPETGKFRYVIKNERDFKISRQTGNQPDYLNGKVFCVVSTSPKVDLRDCDSYLYLVPRMGPRDQHYHK